MSRPARASYGDGEELRYRRSGMRIVRARAESPTARQMTDQSRSAEHLPPEAARERARRCLIYQMMLSMNKRIDYRPEAVANWKWPPSEAQIDEWLASLGDYRRDEAERHRRIRDRAAASAAAG